jgi:hypothetical protein
VKNKKNLWNNKFPSLTKINIVSTLKATKFEIEIHFSQKEGSDHLSLEMIILYIG